MSLTNTDIQFKRSVNTPIELKDIDLNFAEPFFIDNTTHATDGTLENPVNAYLVLGRKSEDNTIDNVTVGKSPVIKAMTLDRADNLVFYNSENKSITNEAGVEVPVNRLTTINKNISDLSKYDLSKYYILCQTDTDNVVYKFTLDDIGIFINGNGIMQGTAWNDYAELRDLVGEAQPGMVVCDNGDGSVSLSKEKLQPCAHVVSDTYGHLIGDRDKGSTIPVAVAGRVLVNIYNTISDLEIGDCICAGRNGLGEKMTRQEIINYPDRIIGTVCEIPVGKVKYGDVDIKGRVWINVK